MDKVKLNEITSDDQFKGTANDVMQMQLKCRQLKIELEGKKRVLDAEYNGQIAELKNKIADATRAMTPYAIARRAVIFGGKKSIKLALGKIGFKTNKAKLLNKDGKSDDAVADALLQSPATKPFVVITYALDKNKIKSAIEAETAAAKELEKHFVIVNDEEFFIAENKDTEVEG